MASRSQSPKWSPDGKYIAFISDRSGRDEIWICDPDGKGLKKITTLDNEKGALVWTPDSKLLLYTAADKKLYGYSVADGKTTVVTSSDVGRIGIVAVSPDSKWVTFSKQDTHHAVARLHRADRGRRGASQSSDDSLLFAENNAVWTADGKYIVFTSSAGVEQRRRVDRRRGSPNDDADVGAAAARPGQGSAQPRHRQRGAGAGGRGRVAGRAAGAAAGGGRRGAAVEVKIDWDGLTRRARRLNAPGEMFGGLTRDARRPLGGVHVVDGAGGRAPRRAAARPAPAIYIMNVESEPVDARAAARGRSAGRRPRRAAAAAGWRLRRRSAASCSRATAARSTSARAADSMRPRSPAGGGGARRRRRRRPAGGAGRSRRRDGGAESAAGRGAARPRGTSPSASPSRSITRRCASRCSTRAGAS